MKIRPAVETDMAALTRLYNNSLKHMAELQPGSYRVVPQDEAFVKAGLVEENATVFVAELDHELVGLVSIFGVELSPKPYRVRLKYADLDTLYVDEDYRGQGIGTALFDAAWAWAKAHDYHAMELMALAENHAARKFYEKHGMHEKSVYFVIEEVHSNDPRTV